MAGPAVLAIKVIADASKATKEIKGVGTTAKTTGGKLSGMAGALGGALAVGAAVTFGKAAVGAAEESASAIAGLETAFRNAGDATGTAAQDAIAYAGELSALIGVEDEQILAAQTTLATFQNVSDETARASGVFDRATTAAADLAAAGFGSLESNAATLGKILQDPAKGLAKVQKFTGPLTDSQKELITAMAEAGDVAGAQAAVLDILEGKVGGTAAATATTSDKMSVAFGEVSEAVGGVLLPILDLLAPVLSAIAGFLQENIAWLLPLAGAVVVVVGAIKLWNMWQMILNGTLVLNPIGLVIAAVVALIAVVILVIKNWDKISAFLVKIWNKIKTVAMTVFGAIGRFFTGIWNSVKRVIETVWGGIVAYFTGIWSAIKLIFEGARTFFQGFIDFVGTVGEAISDAWAAVTGALNTAWSGVVDVFKGVVNTFIRGVNVIIGALNKVIGVVNKVPGVNIGTIPKIPTLARGGVLTRPTLFMGGEAGREIVSPERLLRAIIRQEGGTGGGYTLNLHTKRADAQDVAWGFRRLELARTGR